MPDPSKSPGAESGEKVAGALSLLEVLRGSFHLKESEARDLLRRRLESDEQLYEQCKRRLLERALVDTQLGRRLFDRGKERLESSAGKLDGQGAQRLYDQLNEYLQGKSSEWPESKSEVINEAITLLLQPYLPWCRMIDATDKSAPERTRHRMKVARDADAASRPSDEDRKYDELADRYFALLASHRIVERELDAQHKRVTTGRAGNAAVSRNESIFAAVTALQESGQADPYGTVAREHKLDTRTVRNIVAAERRRLKLSRPKVRKK